MITHRAAGVLSLAGATLAPLYAQTYLGPAEFGPFVAVETAKWARVVKQGNIKAQ